MISTRSSCTQTTILEVPLRGGRCRPLIPILTQGNLRGEAISVASLLAPDPIVGRRFGARKGAVRQAMVYSI